VRSRCEGSPWMQPREWAGRDREKRSKRDAIKGGKALDREALKSQNKHRGLGLPKNKKGLNGARASRKSEKTQRKEEKKRLFRDRQEDKKHAGRN